MSDDRTEFLPQLAQLATNLGRALSPPGLEELIASILQATRRVFRAEACSVAILDEAANELTFYAASGGAPDIVGRRMPAGHGLAGWVVASGQPLAVADVTKDSRFARDVAEDVGYVPSSVIAMPLQTERRLLGVIEVLDFRTVEDGPDLELLGLLANEAALAIESSQVFQETGRVLLRALATATVDEGLSGALEAAAERGSDGSPVIAKIAAAFNEFAALDERELHSAAELLELLVRQARRRTRRT